MGTGWEKTALPAGAGGVLELCWWVWLAAWVMSDKVESTEEEAEEASVFT